MRRLFLVIAILSLLAACGWMVARLTLRANDIRVEIQGTEGVRVRGLCTTDRETMQFDSTIPAAVHANGNHATINIEKPAHDGKMAITIYVNGRRGGEVTAAGAYRRVRAQV